MGDLVHRTLPVYGSGDYDRGAEYYRPDYYRQRHVVIFLDLSPDGEGSSLANDQKGYREHNQSQHNKHHGCDEYRQ